MNRPGVILGAAVAVAAVIVGIVVVITSGGGAETSPKSATESNSATTSAAVSRPLRPARTAEQFGANVNYLFNTHDFTPAQVSSQLAALAQTGVTIARSDALWEASEPTAPVNGVHHYEWAFDDAIALALAEHGLRWLPILDYTAPWDESVPGQDHSPPRSAVDYAAFAGAFAARYGAGGTFWRAHLGLTARPVDTYEIWNEPDNGEFWVPTPDAGAYAQLYQRAREAIAAVNAGARVVVGGLKDPAGFLPAMMSADPALRGHIDGVAIHPYGTPLVVLSRIRAARATLASLGLGTVPLYVTEFGWTTRPAGAVGYAPASARTKYLVETVGTLGHLDCGVAAAVLYTWVTPERNALDPQDWYGISDPAGAGGRDVAAFSAGLRAARAPRPAIELCRR